MSRSPLAPDGIRPEVDTVDDVLELVRAGGGRATNARRILVQALFDHSGHLSAEELALVVQAESPEVNVSTVYRNLDELERLGVVTHTHQGHGAATYHLAARRHGHLVCEECGVTAEVPVSLFESMSEEALRLFGFSVNPGHSAVMGRCRMCRGR